MSLDLNQAYKDLQASGGKVQVDGGCHCGAIRYTVSIPIAQDGSLRATRCNCTFCQKLGTTSISPESPDEFKLLKPSSKEEISGDYTRNPETAHKYFCNRCGVHVFGEGKYEFQNATHDFFMVNIATFDQPQDGVDLNKVKISYWDGLNYNWEKGMKDSPWPNGLP